MTNPVAAIHTAALRLADEVNRLDARLRVEMIRDDYGDLFDTYVALLLARPVGDEWASAVTALVAGLYAMVPDDRQALLDAALTVAADRDGAARDFWLAVAALVGEVHRRRAAILSAPSTEPARSTMEEQQ